MKDLTTRDLFREGFKGYYGDIWTEIHPDFGVSVHVNQRRYSAECSLETIPGLAPEADVGLPSHSFSLPQQRRNSSPAPLRNVEAKNPHAIERIQN